MQHVEIHRFLGIKLLKMYLIGRNVLLFENLKKVLNPSTLLYLGRPEMGPGSHHTVLQCDCEPIYLGPAMSRKRAEKYIFEEKKIKLFYIRHCTQCTRVKYTVIKI